MQKRMNALTYIHILFFQNKRNKTVIGHIKILDLFPSC